MALAFKAAGSAASGSTSTISVSYPASKASGDLALILVESGNGATPSDPTGFTLVGAQGVGAGGSEVGGTKLMVYRRTLDGSEGSTVTVNRAAGHTVAVILLYTGHDTTTPITISTGKQMTPATTSLSTNGISSAAGDGNTLFLGCYATDRDSPTPATLSSSAFANASGSINNRVNVSDNIAGGGGIIAEELDPSSDSTGTVSHSITADSTIATSFLLRINAAAGGTTYNDTLSESLTASDSYAAVITFVTTRSESLTAADSLTAAATFAATIAESVTGADSLSATATFGITLSEGLTAADALAAGLVLTAAVSESLVAADSIAAAVTFGAVVSEDVAAADDYAAVATFSDTITETISAFDDYTGSLPTGPRKTVGWHTPNDQRPGQISSSRPIQMTFRRPSNKPRGNR